MYRKNNTFLKLEKIQNQVSIQKIQKYNQIHIIGMVNIW